MRSDSWYDVFLFGIISYHIIWYDITLPNIVSYYLVWHDEIIPSHPLASCLCIILLLLQSLHSLLAFLHSFSLNISSHISFLSFITLSICLSVCLPFSLFHIISSSLILRRLAPCVVYLDEVDSVLSSRENGDDSSHGTLTSVKTTLMQVSWEGRRRGDVKEEEHIWV